jgi:hypothetical protein
MVGRANRRGFGYLRKLPSKRWQASYVGPDLARYSAPSTFAAKVDAEAWLASERALIAAGDWSPPALLHSVYDQPDADSVNAQFDRVIEGLYEKLPAVAQHLELARADILALTVFPKEIWRQISSNNPNERLNREIRRRTDVVGIFPNRESIIRLVGAVLAEQHDEWAEQRRYLGLEALKNARAVLTARVTDDRTEEVDTGLIAGAINA